MGHLNCGKGLNQTQNKLYNYIWNMGHLDLCRFVKVEVEGSIPLKNFDKVVQTNMYAADMGLEEDSLAPRSLCVILFSFKFCGSVRFKPGVKMTLAFFYPT